MKKLSKEKPYYYLNKFEHELKDISTDELIGNFYKIKKNIWNRTDDFIKWNRNGVNSLPVFLHPFHFINTSRLIKIDLSNDIKIRCIPKCCFSYTSIKEISIPDTVSSIKISAFKYCHKLEKIIF